jgi:HEAT repeat protein
MVSREAIRLTSIGLLLWATGCGGDAASQLIDQLQSPDVEVRRAAARDLGKLTPLDERAINALAETLADDDVEVRRLSISALRHAGPKAAMSVPDLERALDDREPQIRFAAALAVKDIEPANRRCHETLINAMRQANGPVMLEVGRMGRGAAWAVPTLTGLLSHDSAKVRALAARSLGDIGPSAAKAETHLKRLLRDPNVAVQDAARQALENIRPAAPSSS